MTDARPPRTLAATIARINAAEQRRADYLAARGWTVHPPQIWGTLADAVDTLVDKYDWERSTATEVVQRYERTMPLARGAVRHGLVVDITHGEWHQLLEFARRQEAGWPVTLPLRGDEMEP